MLKINLYHNKNKLHLKYIKTEKHFQIVLVFSQLYCIFDQTCSSFKNHIIISVMHLLGNISNKSQHIFKMTEAQYHQHCILMLN